MRATSRSLPGLLMTVLLAAGGAGVWTLAPRAQEQTPRYELAGAWPAAWPERWVLGGLAGLCMDAQDHLLVLNRQEDILETSLNAGYLAPAIIELDAAGRVVNSWGDQKLLDRRLHSCFFDKENNVWIGSAPSGMIQKYTHDGSKLLMQIGTKGVFDSSDGTVKGQALNSDAARFFGPSSIYVDPANGDIYLADGESAGWNRRVVVMDSHGTFLRQWQPEGMNTVHCLVIAHDGLAYVCNRQNDRVQVYDKQGHSLKNFDIPWKQYTPSPDGKRKPVGGSSVALAFSPDPKQSLLFLVNQANAEVEVIDRQSGRIVSTFGNGVGHYAGQFDQPHAIAVDSHGNVYVAENRGARIQKYVPVKH